MNTTTEKLLLLMCIPPDIYSGVVKTADGEYIAKKKGDVGYNDVFGKPVPPHAGPASDFIFDIWATLTPEERKAVVAMAEYPVNGEPIHLEDFGVPIKGYSPRFPEGI